MMMRLSIVIALCWLSVGCSRDQQPAASGSPPTQPVQSTPAKSYDENVPPTRKEIIRALLANQDVSLSIDSSCSGVGTNPTDGNIGDYISGFLAEQNSDKGKNWLDIQAKRAPAQQIDSLWDCNVVIRHVDGDDRWGWGVSFQMKAKDHSIVRSSIRCTGAG